MAELKPEPAHSSLWSNYGGAPVPLSARYPNTMDSATTTSASSQQHPGRPRSSHHSIDHPYSYPRYAPEEPEPYERYPQSSLTPHHSYPSLKRPHHGGEAQASQHHHHQQQQQQQATPHPPYQEIVQDLRDDGSKLSVNHDHKLLSFRPVQDKHTIVDQHGRMQHLELSAQLHGMFFLSEMPANTNEGAMLQPELTCYRRNLFQISGMEVTISAIESVDGHPVRLIVIPWKTPPPNSPELPQTPDQEPPSLPLIPFPDDGQEPEGEYAVYPIGWRRLQFRIATANNGRRKELQQHFVLHLKVMGSLANGTKTALAESTTAPIVVRGRSPRNFQARKEIPLLGSSAGSRGQALVETGLGIVAGPLAVKPHDPKLRLELPRTAFTFNAAKIPGSPMTVRSQSYSSGWNGPGPLPMTGMPGSANASYPPSTMAADPYHKIPASGAPGYPHEPAELPLQTSMPSMQLSLSATDQQQPPPIRSQYPYAPGSSAPSQLSATTPTLGSSAGGAEHSALSVPRYVDSNPRPNKSPRHGSHPSTSSLTNEATSEYRYGPPSTTTYENPSTYGTSGPEGTSGSAASAGSSHPPARDYYSSTSSWTTSAGETSSSTVHAYHNGSSTNESGPYSYRDPYKSSHSISVKNEHPTASSNYNYSWSST
ncbi:hypothetical protein GGS20DRAFT_576805 [Poronia punctata]|nr:hypothetical protein GGS20DRAFT_576805 [Poronia punctata]